MTKEQQEIYDSWSKEEIYEAYLIEHNVRVLLAELLKRKERELAEARYADK